MKSRRLTFSLALVGLAVCGAFAGFYAYERSRPTVVKVGSAWNTGANTSDLLLAQDSTSKLFDVNLTVTLYRQDAQVLTVNRFFSSWDPVEAKTITVDSAKYEKIVVEGTASAGSRQFKIEGPVVRVGNGQCPPEDLVRVTHAF